MEYLPALCHRLRTTTNLRDEAITRIASRLACCRLAKHELLLCEGEQCNFWGFVQVGLVRLYTHTATGDEYTNGFALEGALLTDLMSLGTQAPSLETMQALEETVLVYLTYDGLQAVFAEFPAFGHFGRQLYERLLIEIKQRIIYRLHAAAPARYRYLLHTQPQVLRRGPLKYIASYLSVTSSTLSRIRRRLRSEH